MEVSKVEHREGGVLIPNKSPGLVSFTDVTLERGATSDRDMWDWMVEVANAAANSGLIDDEYKRNLDIVQLDRDGSELRRWRITNAWPMKLIAGEWDNEADENVIESVTLTYDYFDLVQ
jgi:phage tail-like protein